MSAICIIHKNENRREGIQYNAFPTEIATFNNYLIHILILEG